ncbi:MAG TPA: hypothetical protein DCE33_10935, partial [Rhodospirillaceae bacterium]|nr:hypothetical protein [Rhodospirillaceae bacterium]
LSGGRLDIGLGRGYQTYEFERFGNDLQESRDRFDEGVDILLKAFEGKPFSYDGKYYSFEETSVYPQPVQNHDRRYGSSGKARARLKLLSSGGSIWFRVVSAYLSKCSAISVNISMK